MNSWRRRSPRANPDSRTYGIRLNWFHLAARRRKPLKVEFQISSSDVYIIPASAIFACVPEAVDIGS